MNLTYLEVDHKRTSYDTLRGNARAAFTERLKLSWLYHDHALEGVVLTENELVAAFSGKPVRNYCEGRTQSSLRNMRAALDYLYEAAEQDKEITIAFCKDLHSRLSDPKSEAAGRYRKRNTSPGVYNLNIIPAGSISYYFRKFITLYNEELRFEHPIRAAAMTHWEFMKLFPFDEKSGEVGRLLMNYILIKNGYPPAVIHAMDRHHYFAALDGSRTDLISVLVVALKATLEAADAFSSHRLETSHANVAL